MTERAWLELSLAQRSIWLEAKLNRTSLYLLGGWSKISARLDESDVRQAISLMMARHEALRLRVDDKEPRQWLDSSVQAPLTVTVLETTEQADWTFRAYMEKAFSQPMPWGDNPLFHIDLVRVEPDTSYLLWRFHHLIADSFSVQIAIEHWIQAYRALTSDSVTAFAPSSGYLRIIESDKAYLQSREYKDDIIYWKRRFRTLPPLLIRNADSGTVLEKAEFSSEWTTANEQYSSLVEMARGIGVPLQRVFFALFAIALRIRYQQTDLVMGLALHRRDLASRYSLGMLSGVISVRFEFRDAMSALKCIYQFSEQVDSDLRHQRFPVDELSRVLGLFRAGRPRLFEVVLSYLPAGSEPQPLNIEGLIVETGTKVTKESSPITFHLQELVGHNGIIARVSVNDQIVDCREAAHLSGLLRELVEELLSEPSITIDELMSRVARRERDTLDKDVPSEDPATDQWIL